MNRPTTIQLSAGETAILQATGARLAALVAPGAINLAHDAIDKPAPGSPIDKAWKAQLSDAYEQARMRLDPAEDQLRAILTILSAADALPNFPLFTLVRGAAVPTLHARYLAEPGIDEVDRLARGMSARLVNLEQQHRAHPEVQGDHYARRVEHLRQRAERHAIPVNRNKKGVITGFGSDWPSDTELSNRYIPVGATFFRYLSGFGHSLPWAIYPMHKAQDSEHPDVKNVSADLDVQVFAAVLTGALNLYDETIRLLIKAAGYPASIWEEVQRG